MEGNKNTCCSAQTVVSRYLAAVTRRRPSRRHGLIDKVGAAGMHAALAAAVALRVGARVDGGGRGVVRGGGVAKEPAWRTT